MLGFKRLAKIITRYTVLRLPFVCYLFLSGDRYLGGDAIDCRKFCMMVHISLECVFSLWDRSKGPQNPKFWASKNELDCEYFDNSLSRSVKPRSHTAR